MYLLTKSILAVMLGFISSVVLGFILIPILKKLRMGQRISSYVSDRHQLKEGTPTFGGLIFILPTLLITIGLLITNKIELTEEEQNQLLSNANYWKNESDTIIDLTDNLSVAGHVSNETGEQIIEVDDKAIIYDPTL